MYNFLLILAMVFVNIIFILSIYTIIKIIKRVNSNELPERNIKVDLPIDELIETIKDKNNAEKEFLKLLTESIEEENTEKAENNIYSKRNNTVKRANNYDFSSPFNVFKNDRNLYEPRHPRAGVEIKGIKEE